MQDLLPLFPELPFSTACAELISGVAALQLIDRLRQLLNLVTRARDIFLELIIGLIPTFYLCADP